MTDATVPIGIVSVPAPAPTLRRELGRWSLTAIGVNQVIGSAVFILPSQVAAQLGNWSTDRVSVGGVCVTPCCAVLRRIGQSL
jgi:hypothetical protein